jgi:hypothetical protein
MQVGLGNSDGQIGACLWLRVAIICLGGLSCCVSQKP